MKILDCESIDSTYSSMEKIFCIERHRLEDLLGNLDLDEACRRAGDKTAAEILLEAVVKHSGSRHPAFDRTCWFHFTRSHPRNSFNKGILPLREALPYLWGLLLMLLPGDFPLEKWYGFARNPPSDPYHSRLNDPARHGPFALLQRHAGLSCKPSGIHGSLVAPEIVEEICSAFRADHGFDLLRAFRENTRPCIVTFIDSSTCPGTLGPVLHSLYRDLHGGPFSGECRVDFDAKGVAIPRERIRKVEFL